METPEVNDEELIRRVVDEMCSDSFRMLCDKYEKVFFKMCQRYASPLRSVGIAVEEVLEEKNYTVWFCITKYDSSRGTKLSTFIGNYARYLCLKSITSKRLSVDFEDNDIKSLIESSQEKNHYENESASINYDGLKFVFNSLQNSKHKEILRLRYFSSDHQPTWKDIAKKMNISIPTAISLHGKAIKSLKCKIKSPDKL